MHQYQPSVPSCEICVFLLKCNKNVGEILVYARALPALPALHALHALPAIHALPALPYCFNRLPFIDGALQI